MPEMQSADLQQGSKGNTMEQRETPQQMVLEQLDIHMQKKKKKEEEEESRHKPDTLQKINSK